MTPDFAFNQMFTPEPAAAANFDKLAQSAGTRTASNRSTDRGRDDQPSFLSTLNDASNARSNRPNSERPEKIRDVHENSGRKSETKNDSIRQKKSDAADTEDTVVSEIPPEEQTENSEIQPCALGGNEVETRSAAAEQDAAGNVGKIASLLPSGEGQNSIKPDVVRVTQSLQKDIAETVAPQFPPQPPGAGEGAVANQTENQSQKLQPSTQGTGDVTLQDPSAQNTNLKNIEIQGQPQQKDGGTPENWAKEAETAKMTSKGSENSEITPSDLRSQPENYRPADGKSGHDAHLKNVVAPVDIKQEEVVNRSQSEASIYKTAEGEGGAKPVTELQMTKDGEAKPETMMRDDSIFKAPGVDTDAKDNSMLSQQDQSANKFTESVAASKEKENTPEFLQAKTLDQIVKKAVVQINNGQNEVKIELKPEFLGQVRMQIATENNLVTVRVLAELPIVKEMIENNLHQLKADLQQQGLEVDKLEVSVSNDSKQNQQARDKKEGGSENSSGENGLEADANDGTPSVQRANIWAGTGAVDMFA